jgi:MFS family permease
LISTSTTVFWLTAMLAVYTFGEAIFNPVLNDGVAELASDERRGGVMSVLNMLKQTANAVSPPAFGLVLVSFGLDSVFLTAAGFMIVFLLVLVRFLDPSA